MIETLLFFACASLLFALLINAEARKVIREQDALIAQLRRTIDRHTVNESERQEWQELFSRVK